MESNLDSRIPVTIISGFLGAGKTTLLNNLINNNKGKKLAIIENEFGEIPIDNELVVKADDGIFEMSNGCICCSLNEDLIPILIKLINRKDKIDHLIIETTGIADPGPVANSFLADVNVNRVLRLDAIITLVDGQFIEQQLENQDEACKQVALADIILINKIDKIEDYFKDTIRNIVGKINPHAQIFFTRFGEVKNVDLLNINSFSADDIIKTKFETQYDERGKVRFSFDPAKADVKPQASIINQKFKTHKHSDISSLSFVFPEPLDPFRFDIWIRMTLNRSESLVYRAKGILHFRIIDYSIIFQSVNNQYVTEQGADWDSEERLSKIVFIGKNLDKEYFETGLKACCATEIFDPETFYKSLNL